MILAIFSRAAVFVCVSMAFFSAGASTAQADPVPPPQFEDALFTTVPAPPPSPSLRMAGS